MKTMSESETTSGWKWKVIRDGEGGVYIRPKTIAVCIGYSASS